MIKINDILQVKNKKSNIVKIILSILLGFSAYILVKYLIGLQGLELKIATFAIISAIWIYITKSIALYYYNVYKEENKTLALEIKSAIQIVSFFLLTIYALIYFNISITYILASSTILGIIVGFALQPILSNFFAGILLLLSGSLKPGDEIRILNVNIPYHLSFLPPYKFFSRDFLYIGYRGIVYEVSLLFTKILLKTGEVIIVPNNVILNGAIINYSISKKESELKEIKIRFEVPQILDPETTLKDVEKIVEKYGKLNVYIDEVSEKDYYIISIEGNLDYNNYREIKSEILKELIKYKNIKMKEIKGN